MKNIVFFLLASFLLTSTLEGQEIYFDVLHKDKNIGFIKISKSKDKKLDKYIYQSDFNLNKGIDIRIQDEIESTFSNDTLLSSKIKSDLNSSNRFLIEQKYDQKNKTLNRIVNNKAKQEEVQPILNSYITLFWQQPKNNQVIYSEFFNLPFKISINKNTVSVTDNRNRIQKFVYDTNGKLKSASLSNSIDDYEVVIRK